MGISILELALRSLQEAGFAADAAYPGQKITTVTEPVAAVHIKKVDSASRTVTVEVTILSPAALGGTACENAALEAVKALQAAAALCVQNGCVYDSLSQVYSVSILATFSGIAEESNFTPGPGFQVHLNDTYRPWVTAFQDEKVQEQTMEFATRSPVAIAITPGSYYWNISLEELFPPGFTETEAAEGEFQLRVLRENRADIFTPCRWTSITRSFTPQGLRRVCKGIALTRKEDNA